MKNETLLGDINNVNVMVNYKDATINPCTKEQKTPPARKDRQSN